MAQLSNQLNWQVCFKVFGSKYILARRCTINFSMEGAAEQREYPALYIRQSDAEPDIHTLGTDMPKLLRYAALAIALIAALM